MPVSYHTCWVRPFAYQSHQKFHRFVSFNRAVLFSWIHFCFIPITIMLRNVENEKKCIYIHIKEYTKYGVFLRLYIFFMAHTVSPHPAKYASFFFYSFISTGLVTCHLAGGPRDLCHIYIRYPVLYRVPPPHTQHIW